MRWLIFLQIQLLSSLVLKVTELNDFHLIAIFTDSSRK